MFEDVQIKYLKGVGEKRAEQLTRLGADSVYALLHMYPRTYEDWGHPIPIMGAEQYEKCVIKATISQPVLRRKSKSGAILFETRAFDETGTVQILIFNNKYAAAKLEMGATYLFYGTIAVRGNMRQILSPAIELPGTINAIRPIYRQTKNLSSKYIEGLMKRAIATYINNFSDPLPLAILDKYNLMPQAQAISSIHFPRDFEALNEARKRLIFEELFELQVGLRLMSGGDKSKTTVKITEDYSNDFYQLLPFEPTSAQKLAVSSAIDDLMSGYIMNRLLQGDVGSGKTMVATALAYVMARNGYQTAMMAPTEILAAQHYETVKKFFDGTGISVGLITGSMTAVQKRNIQNQVSSGEISFVVGTHALISDGIEFNNLGLVMTDEQHRFGVRQRGLLAEKGRGVHVLVMSATPIPRTLALSIYGDLDVSIINELPKGRVPIETYKIDSTIRQRAYNYIKKHLDEGRQAYIVCPLVEEGELEGVLSASEHYEKIKSNEFKNYKVGLLHGQMKTQEKNEVMHKFLAGEIDLLVSTVVIEVGVDVPNAVIMLIENAERFGLSQLHQLRGRVGRGKWKSTCILLSDNKSQKTEERLRVMCETSDGFEIANRDLALRGPGDFFGSRQHGLPELRLANLMTDMDVLIQAGAAAEEILCEDKRLELPENQELKRAVTMMFEHIGTSY